MSARGGRFDAPDISHPVLCPVSRHGLRAEERLTEVPDTGHVAQHCVGGGVKGEGKVCVWRGSTACVASRCTLCVHVWHSTAGGGGGPGMGGEAQQVSVWCVGGEGMLAAAYKVWAGKGGRGKARVGKRCM